jgi:hypothetical protein
MKKFVYGVAALAVFGLRMGVGQARAGDDARILADLEIWPKSNIYKRQEDSAGRMAASMGAAKQVSVSDGYGGKVGFWIPTETEGFNLGLSFGFTKGPRGNFKLTSASDFTGSKDHVEFYRMLLEVKEEFTLSEWCKIGIRGGTGFARGEVRETSRTSGPMFGNTSGTAANHGTGIVWEAGPFVTLIGGSIPVVLGLVYTDFPKIKETEEFRKIKWTPIGLRLGIEL